MTPRPWRTGVTGRSTRLTCSPVTCGSSTRGGPGCLRGMEADPDFYDAQVAGWWVWGVNAWIGAGWCPGTGRGSTPATASASAPPRQRRAGRGTTAPHLGNAGRGVNRKRPHLGDAGQGVNRKRPHLGDAGQGVNRQRPTSATPGGRATTTWSTGRTSSATSRSSPGDSATSASAAATGRASAPAAPCRTGPRSACSRPRTSATSALQTCTRSTTTRFPRRSDWCLEHGDDPRLRIVLAGYRAEHDDLMPDTWRRHYYSRHPPRDSTTESAARQDGNHANRANEVLWFSPALRDPGPTRRTLGGPVTVRPLDRAVIATDRGADRPTSAEDTLDLLDAPVPHGTQTLRAGDRPR